MVVATKCSECLLYNTNAEVQEYCAGYCDLGSQKSTVNFPVTYTGVVSVTPWALLDLYKIGTS